VVAVQQAGLVDRGRAGGNLGSHRRRVVGIGVSSACRSKIGVRDFGAAIVACVRVLFGFAGGSGHLNPLLPVARAVAAAGHEVVFAPSPSLVGRVEAAGFRAIAAGAPYEEETPVRRPLLAVDADREDRDVRDGFAGRMARDRAAAMLEVCAAWRPDVLVCDEMDFGSVVAAQRAGLRYARVLVIAAGVLARAGLIGPPLQKLRAEHGLAPDPGLAMLDDCLVLSPFPPSFRDPRFPLPAGGHALRWTEAAAEPRADGPVVYFTLGTIFNLESGDLFNRVLDGLARLGPPVLCTTGPHLDPAELGPQPAHVRIERYVPQASVLPGCALVVSHGGSGSVMGALSHGVPMVLAPMGADQPHNAARCAALGVGETIDVTTVTADEVLAVARRVLDTPSYAERARALQREIAELPAPEAAVPLLEALHRQDSAHRRR
jgi:UDP:flavonoid glycosyltransferase YjiC (YdhE family)